MQLPLKFLGADAYLATPGAAGTEQWGGNREAQLVLTSGVLPRMNGRQDDSAPPKSSPALLWHCFPPSPPFPAATFPPALLCQLPSLPAWQGTAILMVYCTARAVTLPNKQSPSRELLSNRV
ncbi:hypothetical protein SKAU_G00033760 [Synaphobranchus kaupii]|uniref:Uncharacterized protein n=1 Tax=Synaphobranchus kaupii TaxID=118154 RepID=A0A9Q1GFB2_SYNKA|nr:hypothetical protein SKAU_G00033760 [Synaphobranchus kaupii]